MIVIVLFVAAGLCYLLANYWRELTAGRVGTSKQDRVAWLLTFDAICLTIAAVILASVNMITVVTG